MIMRQEIDGLQGKYLQLAFCSSFKMKITGTG